MERQSQGRGKKLRERVEWQLNAPTARAQFGFTPEQVEALKPAIAMTTEQTFALWRFMEGWHPERLPVALACVPVEDAGLMIHLLQVLRDVFEERREAEQAR